MVRLVLYLIPPSPSWCVPVFPVLELLCGRSRASCGTPRAPHTRSRTRAPGSPGPRAPPIAVSGGGQAPACGARLHLKEEEVGSDEQLGRPLDQEGDGDGGGAGARRDPGRGDGQQVHRPCAHRRWWPDIYFLPGHTHKVK